MTLLKTCTTRLSLCVVLLFVASGFATDITVNNPSFETLPHGISHLDPGEFTSFLGIPQWTTAGTSSFTGQFHPVFGTHGLFDFVGPAPNDGNISAYSQFGTISQTVSQTVEDGQIYTLTVDLGHRHGPFNFTSSADLLVGGPGGQMFMATGTTPSPGHWSPFIATFTGTAANAGKTITIQLNSTGGQGNFDSVSLTSVPVPEPSSMLLLGSAVLGLAQVLRRKLT